MSFARHYLRVFGSEVRLRCCVRFGKFATSHSQGVSAKSKAIDEIHRIDIIGICVKIGKFVLTR